MHRTIRSVGSPILPPFPVILMLSFIVYFARRKRAYVWSPALDLRDPHVAAALVPMINS